MADGRKGLLLIGLLASVASIPAQLRAGAGKPEGWVPIRWDGGPLEVSRRAKDTALAGRPAQREAIGRWYDPATLDLLRGTPLNCILVTLSAGADPELEERQHLLVREYARVARQRGIAVLGIVHPGSSPVKAAIAAAGAGLDGLVLDGDFSEESKFMAALESALREQNSEALVIPIARHASSVGMADTTPAIADPPPLAPLAVAGVRPSARDLADMGIRAGASAEPWIESNIWMVRFLRFQSGRRPIWIDQQPNPSAAGDYIRCVADAAVAGGRWMVSLDDDLRMRLYQRDAAALATWQRIASYLRFAEDHADWRGFQPYGNVGVLFDAAAQDAEFADEYLNLVARRQVPYRLIPRSSLRPAALAGFRAVLAPTLAPPTETERKILRDFAEQGGLLVTGPAWGNPPKDDPYAEVPTGKGRVAVYREDPPDPGDLARDLLELLPPEVMGLSVFNVPSTISYASTTASGKSVLIQLLNYAGTPSVRVTVRFNGIFKTARLYTPENPPAELAARATADGRTEVAIPRLEAWAALILE
ncbi:MAG TPA: hypothetical protein VFA33_20285 [Bryobacteraceae bacterium]|nr:hypothetical protein [Bryobacteraceae bacterium]